MECEQETVQLSSATIFNKCKKLWFIHELTAHDTSKTIVVKNVFYVFYLQKGAITQQHIDTYRRCAGG